MDRFYSFRRFNFLTLFFGLFMLAVMAGCVHVETTCPSCCGGKGTSSDPGDGGCTNYPTTGSYLGSANGFWDTTTSQVWTASGNCLSGKKCNPTSPGRCTNGTCKNWVTPSTMYCKCDCNP